MTNFCFDILLEKESISEMKEIMEENDLENIINYSLFFTYEVLKMRAKGYEPAMLPIKLDGSSDPSRRAVIIKDRFDNE